MESATEITELDFKDLKEYKSKYNEEIFKKLNSIIERIEVELKKFQQIKSNIAKEIVHVENIQKENFINDNEEKKETLLEDNQEKEEITIIEENTKTIEEKNENEQNNNSNNYKSNNNFKKKQKKHKN